VKGKGDFGFLLQSSSTARKQVRRGKQYPIGQLRALNLRLADLLAIEAKTLLSGDKIATVALSEHQRTIRPTDTFKTRPRAATF
jgi:hypothetical protein